jgi:hypothetical protein
MASCGNSVVSVEPPNLGVPAYVIAEQRRGVVPVPKDGAGAKAEARFVVTMRRELLRKQRVLTRLAAKKRKPL